MENFNKLLEDEWNSMTSSLEKIEDDLEGLLHNRQSNSANEDIHVALSILEKISDTGLAMDEMIDQVERRSFYLNESIDETQKVLKTMTKLMDHIVETLEGEDVQEIEKKTTDTKPKKEYINEEDDYFLEDIEEKLDA